MDVLVPAVVTLAIVALVGAVATLLARSRTRAEMAGALAAAQQDNKWLTEEVARQKQALGATGALLDKADQKLRDAFQSLAAEALKDNRSAFLDLAKTSFAGFQQPITETLKNVDRRLTEAERERVAAYAQLAEQVAALGTTTDMLSRALRKPDVRGRWGEIQLRRVVEIAGMLEKCDFQEQRTFHSDTGLLRPDLIVYLPGGKQIVIDAKTPLEAFWDAQAATSDDMLTDRLKAHAKQVRKHMNELSSKGYWELLTDSTEMVVMFLPGEMLFSGALQNDPGLIEHGFQERVLLASPITLIALLSTVAHSWRQAALAENYREVARLGREFYERLATFSGRLDEVRKKLDGAVHAYNEAAASFESRVLVTARRLKDLDVTSAEELPSAEPIDTVPRVLRQAALMGLPDDATVDDPEDS